MYDEISICVNDIIKHPEALVAASKFAERYSAVLNACYLKLDAAEIWRWQSTNPIELANQFLVDEEAREANIKSEFETLTKQYACHTSWHTLNQSGDPLRRMVCSDIIFVNQPQESEASFTGSVAFINRLIMESRRPVMMIPHNWNQSSIGSKVLLGWNSSHEAMRAISDAMPILKSADKVLVLDVQKEHLFQADEDYSPGIEDYLDSKNVDYELFVKHADSGRNGEHTALSRFAEENAIDLVVVGGYGHSRFRELMMGGMTKYLIENSAVPVLFSH